MCVGDENQFAVVDDRWADTPLDPEQILRSDFLHRLCGGVQLRLNRCRRSCEALYRLYSNPPGLEELRRLLPYRGPGRYNLCLSHRTRRRVIKRLQDRRDKSQDHLFLAEDSRFPLSQDLMVFVGEKLVCCKSNKAWSLFNGAFLTVTSLRPLRIRDDETEEELEVPVEQFHRHLRSALALTYYVCQARTLSDPPGTVVLYETRHRKFSSRHLLVGLSRAASVDKVSIA